MTLQPEQTLGRYRILEKLGAGGMGEVWAAEDTRLKRKIALKVLPSWTASNERLRARFEREAQAVAALNHPNIVTIHSVEEEDGILFLTMELIEGEPLSKRIRSALSTEKIFALATPLADAVAAAHDRGILHRDLKPDNVMVTSAGAVKVLDFGLAKLREEMADQPLGVGASDSLTREGGIVGTAAYMSPEQAEGKPVGPESDVFALGIILYQMATGERPFSGETPVSLISSILKDNPPPVTELNRSLPRHLGRIVRRCLAKDPSRRYPTGRELRNELEMIRDELAAAGPGADDAETPAPSRSRLRGWTVVAAIGVLAVVAAVGWLRPGGPDPGLTVARVAQQTFLAGVETNPALSPDGQFLAYTAATDGGNTDILLQRVGGGNPIDLTAESDAAESQPAFSPDGTHLAFRSERDGGGIYVMGATGEAVRRLTDFGHDPAWSPDGTRLVVATESVASPMARNSVSALWVVDVETGESREIFEGDAVQPSWSPHGERIAFWTAFATAKAGGQRDLGTIRADGTDPVMLTDDASVDWRPQWSPDGTQLYFASDRGGSMNLWRMPVDEKTGRTLGEPEALTVPSLWAGPFVLSGDGRRLAYVAQDERGSLRSLAFDPRRGIPAGIPRTVTEGARIIQWASLSPNGEWIAFSNLGSQEDLYLVRADGSGLRKLTDDTYRDRGVGWMDDDHLVFYSNREGAYEIWSIGRDGGDLHRLTQTTGQALWTPRLTRDGTRMMVNNADGTYLFDLDAQRPLRMEDATHIGAGQGDDPRFRGMTWSADGTRILGMFMRPAMGGYFGDLAMYDVRDGTFRRFAAPGAAPASVGGFLPDDRRFTALAGRTLYIVDSVSGEWSAVMSEGPGTGAAFPSPDGTTLYFIDNTTEADIWVADLG